MDYIGKLRHAFDQFFDKRAVICLVNNPKGFGSSSWPGGGQETQRIIYFLLRYVLVLKHFMCHRATLVTCS